MLSAKNMTPRNRSATSAAKNRIKVPNKHFYEHNVPMPLFISSDAIKGGELIAREMSRKANESKAAGSIFIVLLGPEHSPTAMRRGQRCIWILQKERHKNIVPVMIDSWDEAKAWEKCAERLRDAVTATQGIILLFCADDYIMLYLDRMIGSEYGTRHKDRIFLLGYDGVKNIDNSLLAKGATMFWATISQEPEELGRAAFRMLYFSYNKRVAVKNQLVEPRLVTAAELGAATTRRDATGTIAQTA